MSTHGYEPFSIAKAGAFEALVRDYQKLCWHIVFRMVRDPDDARDLCQETFLRVHRQLHQFRFECPLKSWIGRIAYSIALRHLERRRATPVSYLEDGGESAEALADESFDLEAASGDEQLSARLREGVDALPPVPRTLVTLYHLEELLDLRNRDDHRHERRHHQEPSVSRARDACATGCGDAE